MLTPIFRRRVSVVGPFSHERSWLKGWDRNVQQKLGPGVGFAFQPRPYIGCTWFLSSMSLLWKICCLLNKSCMSPTLVEALLLTLLSLAEQSHTFVTAVLSMMSRWSVGSLVPIYLHSLLSGSFTYCLTHPSLSSTPRLLAEQYVFASAQAAIFVFGSVGTFVLTDCKPKFKTLHGPRPVCTSHRQSVSQSVRSSLGIEGLQTCR